jgi:TetR/AcrR family transcriptional repressor of nem operon
MAKRRDTRQILIEEGEKAFLLNGYYGVGLATILKDAGIPKGSFYFFFESKESFVLAILDAYEARYIALRASFFEDSSRPALKRLWAYLDCLKEIHRAEEPLGGCLFGVMAQTAANQNAAISGRLAQIFSRWTAQLAALLLEAQNHGEVGSHICAHTTASLLIDAYEGALVRSKAEGNLVALESFCAFAKVLLQ